jgi:hypothetical protein
LALIIAHTPSTLSKLFSQTTHPPTPNIHNRDDQNIFFTALYFDSLMAVPLPGAPPPYSAPPPPYSPTPTAISPAEILQHFLTTSSYAHLLFPVSEHCDGKQPPKYDLEKELEREIEFEKAGMKLREILEVEYVCGMPKIRVVEMKGR